MCSSDLTPLDGDGDGIATPRLDAMTPEQSDHSAPRLAQITNPDYDAADPSSAPTIPELLFTAGEIGRASCRERV